MVVKKFSATWCSPCKVYAKTFERVEKMDDFKDVKFEVYDVDSDEGEDLAVKYQIRSVPTTIILDDDENVIGKIIGNVQESVLVKAIKDNISEKKQ